MKRHYMLSLTLVILFGFSQGSIAQESNIAAESQQTEKYERPDDFLYEEKIEDKVKVLDEEVEQKNLNDYQQNTEKQDNTEHEHALYDDL